MVINIKVLQRLADGLDLSLRAFLTQLVGGQMSLGVTDRDISVLGGPMDDRCSWSDRKINEIANRYATRWLAEN